MMGWTRLCLRLTCCPLNEPSAAAPRALCLVLCRLHLVIGGRSTTAKQKPLMLFLHGFPEMWYSWRHQMAVSRCAAYIDPLRGASPCQLSSQPA